MVVLASTDRCVGEARAALTLRLERCEAGAADALL